MKNKILSLLLLISGICFAKNVTVIGAGYVGLTMAGVLKNCGHSVTCVDVDQQKINQLNNQQITIYEPGLYDLLFGESNGNLTFKGNLTEATDADIFYICVGTPCKEDGTCNRTYLDAVFLELLRLIPDDAPDKIICVKSTTPPGTMAILKDILTNQQRTNIHIVFNPEFMREGSAINDIYQKNPLIIGSESKEALYFVEQLYRPMLHDGIKVIKTNYETAEIIKYAWNSFHAIRIAYTNELAVLCRLLNADIRTVIQAYALAETVLPTANLKPGPGYGGSCFPKDTSAFSKILERFGFESSMVHQAIISNNNHIKHLVQDILNLVNTAESDTPKTVAVLGLAFKANTDDIRYAPSIEVIKALVDQGVTVQVYDPQAMENMKLLFPNITYCASPYDAVNNSDCIVLMTEWDELKNLDLALIAQLCNTKLFVDTKNLYSTKSLQENGFSYLNMGAYDIER